jgi:plasmid stabilization system protein ParE
VTRLFVSPRAERDIDEPAAFIARDSMRSARRFLNQIGSTLSTIRQFPGIGAQWIAPRVPSTDLRSCEVRGFPAIQIYYTLDNSRV